MTTCTELTVPSSADFRPPNTDSLDNLDQYAEASGGSFFGPGSRQWPEILRMIRRLAQVNGQEIGPEQERDLGYCAGQLSLLAQEIAEGDCRSDLSGCAALPRLIHEICGSEIDGRENSGLDMATGEALTDDNSHDETCTHCLLAMERKYALLNALVGEQGYVDNCEDCSETFLGDLAEAVTEVALELRRSHAKGLKINCTTALAHALHSLWLDAALEKKQGVTT